MKVTRSALYGLPVDDIMALIADEDFQDEKCRATWALEWEATVRTIGARTIVRTERAMPTEHLPEVARSLIGDRLIIHETQSWTGRGSGGILTADLNVQVQGAPLTGTGTRQLRPNGPGSRDDIMFSIRAAIPFIGRKIEEAAAPAVAAAAEIETELLSARAGG